MVSNLGGNGSIRPRSKAAALDANVPRGGNAPDPDTRCRVCSQDWAWHVEHKPKHAFEDSEGRVFAVTGRDQGQKQRPRLPTDPILRAILIEKGLVTVDELKEAEERLQATGIIRAEAPG